MAEHFRFFDAVETNGQYDREYNAQEFTDYFKALVTTGVMKGAGNQLGVTANGSNMVTSISTGIAFILGRFYENDTPLTFTHDTETLGLNRIDRIVIRMDQNVNARYVRAFIKKGTASTNPVPPALTQNNTVYEISLAQARIIGGQTFIASNAVTDERGTDVICPWAGSKILPNFNDNALEELITDVENMYSVTDGPVLIETDEVNFNNLKDSGFYSIPQDVAINSPIPIGGSWRWLVQVMSAVIPYNTHRQTTQIAIGSTGQIYKRENEWVNGVWNGWVKISFDDQIKRGTEAPEGVISAPVGTLYLRTSGGAATTLYVKTSGAGNTGWTAK